MKMPRLADIRQGGKTQLLAYVLLFGVVGSIVVFVSKAATTSTTFESESGTATVPASVITDNTASGGSAIQFGPTIKLYGTLQTSTANLDADWNAGVRVALLSLAWSSYEPQQGTFSSTYLQSVQTQLQAYRDRGMKVVLDFGEQYSPAWAQNLPNGRYIDQFGDVYADTPNPGKNIVNLVFNQAERDAYQTYIQKVFSDLGTNFYYVRAGGGWFGELNYPEGDYGAHTNEYWGYDAIATGQTGGLPAGMTTNPVPSWQPGTATANHTSASQFSEWYLNSLKNYHDWQISTIRASYPGKIAMLYPSTGGLRPGQLANAVNDDLNGSSSGEGTNGLQIGDDYARYIAGITDSKVIVYTTWLDANYVGTDDTSTNQAAWSPIHFLSYQAAQNPLHLRVAGENTGHNNYTQMQLSFARAEQYNLLGFMWAFEPDLYSGNYATIAQYQSLIAANK